jgi:hypothetical protein
MSTSRDPDRLIHSFLLEGEDELFDQVYDRVRARIEDKPQRVVIGSWRMPIMNKIVGYGLAAAAVVAVVLIGAQLIGSPGDNTGGPGGDSSPTPEASAADPTPESTPESTPVWSGIPAGPVVVNTSDGDPLQVSVDITAPGWNALQEFDGLTKNDDSLDAPETVGGVFLAWVWPAGAVFNVYGDACQWSTTVPETPATTPAEIAAAFVAQAQTEASTPVDVTVGGYAGTTVTLQVPLSYDVPGASREERFAACDDNEFVFYGSGDEAIERNAQGAGQIDELWILDVEGSIVILDAGYGPATPAELVDEMRAFVESATFEAP